MLINAVRGLVSVVIPVRNGVVYLREAIESILQQNYAELEVIVVDNGSSDGSQALAMSFGAPVRLIEEPQLGAAYARNLGVKIANGEYLAFLDADDLWVEGKLKRQVTELEAKPELDMVFTNGENFLSPELTEKQGREVAFLPGIGPFIAPTAMLARRKSFLSVGPLPDLREGEFIAWYGMAMSAGLRSEVIPEALVRRRVHLTNSTRKEPRRADLLRAAKMVLDHRRSRGESAS